MHPFGDNGQSGVPAFLAKLWRLVDDSETNNLISWSSDGRSFIIQNQAKFAKELLPLNYKHNNMASFIRQLNMYGFHKITSIDNGGLKFDKDEMEFSHPYFQKGHPYLLEHIKRKIANPKQPEEKGTPKIEAMNRVLSEVKNMRGRQDSLDSRFSAMKQENEALWREVAILRQKHMKQQQIVNKLIQFLVTLVQPNRSGLGGMGGKRRFQLMINDAPQSSKVKKTDGVGGGPVIHELTEELLDEVSSDVDPDDIEIPNVESPESLGSASPIRPSVGAGSSISNKQFLRNIITSEEFKNFFLDDISAGGSSDHLNYDEIDEIDTNNMAIYDDEGNDLGTKLAPLIKKEIIKQEKTTNSKNPATYGFNQQNQNVGQRGQKRSADVQTLQKKLKQEPMENPSMNAPNPLKITNKKPENPANSKNPSLLLSKNNQFQSGNKKSTDSGKSVNLLDTDILSEFLVSTTTNNNNNITVPSSSTMSSANQATAQPSSSGKSLNNGKSMNDFLATSEMPQTIFDENSQGVLTDDIPLFEGAYNDNDNAMGVFSNNEEKARQLTKYNPNTATDIYKLSTPDDYSNHLDKVQFDLDSLKDLLRSESYQVDPNTLLGHQNGDPSNLGRYYIPQQSFDVDTINKLFGNDDVLQYDLSQGSSEMFDEKKGTKQPSMSLLEYQSPHPTLSTPTNDLTELEMLEMLNQ